MPAESVLTVSVAIPLLPSAPVPSVLLPSRKVTLPPGAALLPAVSVADRVMEVPAKAAEEDAVSAAVACAFAEVSVSAGERVTAWL